jgi:hypothetical protein
MLYPILFINSFCPSIHLVFLCRSSTHFSPLIGQATIKEKSESKKSSLTYGADTVIKKKDVSFFLLTGGVTGTEPSQCSATTMDVLPFYEKQLHP